MDENQLDVLKIKHPALLELCTEGPSGKRPLSKDKLKAAGTEKDFLVICLANEPRIDFYLKLLGLQKSFQESVQVPPTGLADPRLAKAYIDKYFEEVKVQAAKVNLSQLRDDVEKKVLDSATHFSGKLINSDVAEAFALCVGGYHGQPHVSSRTILAGGYSVPLDQAKLDNTGFFQRILKVLEKDPLLQEAEVEETLLAAVEAGAKAAFARRGEKLTPSVDHRLRQILVPSGAHYIAVSPLASGGLCVLFDRAVAQIEQAAAVAAATEQEAEAEEESEADQKAIVPRRLYTRLDFPVGGAIVRNVSAHPKGAIQRPLFFDVPVRRPDLRSVWAFVYKPLKLFIPQDQLARYSRYIEGLPDSIRESSAVTAVKVERAGPIREIALGQHQRLSELAHNLQEIPFREGGTTRSIDAALLFEKRTNLPDTLDLVVANGRFDRSYAQALAEAIALQLYASVRIGAEKRPLHQTDRGRIAGAAQKILENVL